MLNEILTEMKNDNGGSFPETAKLKKKDFKDWQEMMKAYILLDYVKDGDLTLIYMGKKHVASYNNKTQEVYGKNLQFIKGIN